MTALVSDLLAYSRVGRDNEATERTDTAALVVATAELLGPPASFEIVADPGLPTLETTPAALEQVLRNLIGNAIEHHDRDRGTIEVAARKLDGKWEFSVADDGPGIPLEEHEKAFEMLWSSSADDRRGTGMGLALVRRLVERVGGRVWIEADEGRGTTVRFTWPEAMQP
jgi:signal transduction histidine kinase